MKFTFLLSLLLLGCFRAFSQPTVLDEATQKFLNWIIKRDHLQLLCFKTDLSTLYSLTGGDALMTHALENDSTNTVSEKKCLMDFMTVDEASIFHSAINGLKEIKWKKTPYILAVKFYREPSFQEISDSTLKVFSTLSIPIFLNKEKTRVLIGESFSADIAIGRGDLLLCEFKSGEWHIVARINIWNS